MKMDTPIIIDRIKEIITERIGLDIEREDITDDSGLASMVGLDSIGFIELRFQCEEEFNIKVEDKDFSPANFYSCQTLSHFIMNKLGV
ncbi:Acyl carrier protein [Carnimonas sp. R-84981]|uniref:acyl carrier protein n=1 Tax=Carnimonas bestiolae TaxID=3402172 RepID=UPI003EDC081D